MSRPIQTLIFDQRGLDVGLLAAVIQAHYLTPEGNPVKVKIGQGVFKDGCPEGSLRLVDRMDPPPVTEDWDRASIVDRLQ